MKKIMFNDRYGLTQAVLEGKKTMTRRIIPLTDTDREYLETAFDFDLRASVIIDNYSRYRVGEEVAVAQAYKTLRWPALPGIDWEAITNEVTHSKGWNNKMFVKTEYMPHRIRITGIKVERLQDISDEDCLREGVYKHNAAPDALGMDRYKFIAYAYNATPGENIKRWWFQTPREAFAALIDRISGRGTWNRNPWVYVYTFKLIK